MNILDAIIIIFLIVGILAGFRRGLVKQVVLLVGLIIIVIASFYIRVPVATFLYKNLPFFGFKGIFQGVSVLNILIYELIAFLVVFSLLYLVLKILLKITGLIEKLLKATIVLGFFSKIGGGILGLIESYVIVFIILFICSQPFFKISGLENSKLAVPILEYTPVMSSATENIRKVVDEIEKISILYKDRDSDFNEETIKIFIKYNIVSEENIELLREKGKLD